MELCLKIDGGRIEKIRIFGDFFGSEEPSPLEARLTGIPFSPDAVKKALLTAGLPRYFTGLSPDDLLGLFFPDKAGGDHDDTAQA